VNLVIHTAFTDDVDHSLEDVLDNFKDHYANIIMVNEGVSLKDAAIAASGKVCDDLKVDYHFITSSDLVFTDKGMSSSNLMSHWSKYE